MESSLKDRILASRATPDLKALASEPLPSQRTDEKSLRSTYPQLRCSMNWTLKCRLEHVAKLHGIELSQLVATLLKESLPAFEAISRARPDTADAWHAFDRLFAQALAEDEFARIEFGGEGELS